MFDSVLVANRGEIARRVMRTARRMGIRSVAVYSEADTDLPFVAEADDAVLIGGAAPQESYLSSERILAAAKETGARAVHPGYGFLAENPGFARAVQEAGLLWVGPSPEVMDIMGDKIHARNVMAKAGVSVSAGTTEPVETFEIARYQAAKIGYPVMVKAVAGGGGIGMKIVEEEGSLQSAFEAAASAASRSFANPTVFLESYVAGARHVEVQILGMGNGQVVALGERDCSVQRRHQKLVEESPSPGVTVDLRERLIREVVGAVEAVGYTNAGTVECLVQPTTQEYFFLEMNTRLQVEHPVTEMVTGVDLVEQQFLIASGDPRSWEVPARIDGHAIELRVCAEDPVTFMPSPGVISVWEEPVGMGVRVDAGYRAGNTVSGFYDSLLAKLVVHGRSREDALGRAQEAVAAFRIEGVKTNLPFFAELLTDQAFLAGDYDTSIIDRMRRLRR